MSDMVVVGYRTQALALPNHSDGLALLVRSQPWLGSKSDAALLGGGPPPIGTSKDARSFILGQGRQEGQDALTKRRGQIQPSSRSTAIPLHHSAAAVWHQT